MPLRALLLELAEFFEQRELFGRERSRHHDAEADEVVAAEGFVVVGVGRVELEGAEMLEREDVAMLGARTDANVERAVDGIDGDVIAEDGLSEGDGDLGDDILSVETESVMRLDVDGQEQISRL